MNIDFESYFSFAELTVVLEGLAAKFPELAKLSSIGKTSEGRDLWMLTITDFSDHAPLDRPGVWVDGNTHASELAGCQACVHLADWLTREASSARMAELLKTTTFYIVPRISADGAEHVLNHKSIVRSTPLAFPGDSPQENFVMRDLDGDGEVLIMRVPDPSGFFKISDKDPRLMVLRAPDDFSESGGPYYHLYPEGEFENYDGSTRRMLNPFRFDLNRQAPSEFSPREGGAGPMPMFLPEAKALAQAVIERPNIAVCVTYHTYGGFLLRPSSVQADSEMATADLQVYETMGKIGEEITGYKALSVFHDFIYNPKEPTTGAWDDWHYHHRGFFSWTPEIWSLARQAGVKLEKALTVYQDPGSDNLLKIIGWCDQNLPAGSFYKEWKAFEHPQLGAIEIGGWRTLFTWRNPPPKFLKAELSKLSEFVLRLSQMVARVRVKDVTIEKHGTDVYSLRLSLSNCGFLPTHVSENAKHLKVYKTPTAVVRLAAGQKLVQGKSEQFIRHLKGRSDALPWVSSVFGVESDNLHEDVLSWTIQGRGTVEIEASYHGAGVVRRTVTLE